VLIVLPADTASRHNPDTTTQHDALPSPHISAVVSQICWSRPELLCPLQSMTQLGNRYLRYNSWPFAITLYELTQTPPMFRLCTKCIVSWRPLFHCLWQSNRLISGALDNTTHTAQLSDQPQNLEHSTFTTLHQWRWLQMWSLKANVNVAAHVWLGRAVRLLVGALLLLLLLPLLLVP